jgi:hypothetical protein
MLFVLLMAGLVAITLYMALPRFAFEAERDKEDTLVYRGEQYKRAIQLYVRQNKRWPAKIEDLEDTNGKRYLRKRYVDPMTGKDEWRAIHVGPTGVLTDSLIKPKGKGTGSDYKNDFITELGGVAGAPDAPTATNPGLRRRPSDPGSAPTDGSQPGLQAGGQLPGGPPPNQPPGQSGTPPATGSAPPTTAAPPASTGGGSISVFGGVGSGYSTAPGANGTTQPPMQGALQGQTTGGPGSPAGNAATAQQLIQGILTSPRPGGAPGAATTGGMGGVQGGGLAGFASKFEGEGIKIYNEQDEIQKWEFVYDMSKDPMVTGGQQNLNQQQTNPNGQPGATPTTPGTLGPTPPTAPPTTPITPNPTDPTIVH